MKSVLVQNKNKEPRNHEPYIQAIFFVAVWNFPLSD